MELSHAEAEDLLNDPIRCFQVGNKRQFVAAHENGTLYVFQDDNQGSFHGYPVTGQEVCQKYPNVAARIASLLNTTVKRLSRDTAE
jgi:hypothetical protein